MDLLVQLLLLLLLLLLLVVVVVVVAVVILMDCLRGDGFDTADVTAVTVALSAVTVLFCP